MTYLLQFCGVSDPLQLFYLEQRIELKGAKARKGRPPSLAHTALLETARGRGWELDLIHTTVVDVWLKRAEAIRQWQLRLLAEPDDRRLVAGLGTQHDWERRCEAMLQA